MRVLNVGGGSKLIPIPQHYSGWEHQLLDIDPKSEAEVLCSAIEIEDRLAEGGYDAIYCSHNLEHYYRHDIPKVLRGFMFALDVDGFAEIHVPNMMDVFESIISGGRAIDDVMYMSKAGPITCIDMIYGLGSQIESSGNDFMAHKVGFTPQYLADTLFKAGFKRVFVGVNKPAMELIAYAFKKEPSESQRKELKIKDQS